MPEIRGWLAGLLPSQQGRAIITLVSGTVVAQAIAFLVRPLLTRWYLPEDFGILGFIFALISILAVGASGRYEDAIMLPASHRRGLQVLLLSMGISLLVALGIWALLPLVELLLELRGQTAPIPYLVWVPVGLLLVSWSRQLETWFSRRRAFPWMASAQIVRQSVTVPVQAAGGLRGWGALGLVGGAIAGYAVQCGLLLGWLLRRESLPRWWRHGWKPYLALARRYRNFPRYTLWANLLNTLSSQLPLLVLMVAFSPEAAGHYAVAYSTLTLPVTLLGSAVARVFFVEAAEAHRQGTLASVTYTTFRNLWLTGFFPLLALSFVGPDLFEFVFGRSWAPSGWMATLMTPWILTLFVNSPLTFLIDVLERQRLALRFTLLLLGARLLALGAGYAWGEAQLMVGFFSIISALLILGYLRVLTRMAGVRGSALLHVPGESLKLCIGPLLLLIPTLLIPLTTVRIGLWALATAVYLARLPRRVQWDYSS